MDVHVLRVFCAFDGSGGNPLGVVLSGAPPEDGARLRIAAQLGFSETVFVDDRATGAVQIFTPAVELPFAGHPLVGAAWMLEQAGGAPAQLRPPAGRVPARQTADGAAISGRAEWAPGYRWFQLGSPADVEALTGAPEGHELGGAWAWIDEDAGTVRARVFPVAIGIAEDEATGAAAVRLADEVGRPLTIHQGRGSVIEARPMGDGLIEIGGRVVLDEVRSVWMDS